MSKKIRGEPTYLPGIHYVLYDFYSVVNQSSGKMD